jgi:hypothetical protein
MNKLNASPESGQQAITQRGVVRLSPYQPTSELVAALERAEWHGASRRWHSAMLNILRAIASLLAEHEIDDNTGGGSMTQWQIASRARVDERTVRRWLPVLVRLQLIAWRPGAPAVGVWHAEAGYVRVNKKRVVSFVRVARRLKDAARDKHRREVRTRLLEDIRDARAFWVKRLRRSAKADTKSGPPPKRGTSGRAGPDPYVPDTCRHDNVVGRCPSCRRQTSGAGSAGAQTMEGGSAWLWS